MTKEPLFDELMKEYRKLSRNNQRELFWFMKHFQIIKSILNNQDIPLDKFERYVEYAKQKEELLLLFLLYFKNEKTFFYN